MTQNCAVAQKNELDCGKSFQIEVNHVKQTKKNTTKFRWVKLILYILMNITVLVGLLYGFICALDIMSSAFRLLAGKSSSDLFANAQILRNPLAGLMIGVLITVAVQSSSTSTSIFISMVSGGILLFRDAIYMIMGANIGTAVSNTLVSMVQINDRRQFKRAFAGATVHDFFNFLSVLVLLPLEVAVSAATHGGLGPIGLLTQLIVDSMPLKASKDANVELLKALTKPLTDLVVLLDSSTLNDPKKLATANTLIKTCCKKVVMNQTDLNSTSSTCAVKCQFAVLPLTDHWSDVAIGGLLLAISLACLIACLLLLVKLLNNILQKRMAGPLKRFINSQRFGAFSDYVAILVGAIVTMLFQSSSVFTSTLTPLVGTGVLKLERMYPLTLGSNVGTTVTGMMAAMASSNNIEASLQTAMAHLFFNLMGILIWFPIPFMRKMPLALARGLGQITSRHRWFAVVYLLGAYLLIPLAVFGLSLAGVVPCVVVVSAFVLLAIFVGIINSLQNAKSKPLHNTVLRDWTFFPKALRSLEPYDSCCTQLKCCRDDLNEDDEDSDYDDSEDMDSENEDIEKKVITRHHSPSMHGTDNITFSEKL